MCKKTFLFLFLIVVSLIPWSTGEAVTPQKLTLAVTKAGTGSGTVKSSPLGINCGSSCTKAYKQGRTVTLRAKADPGSSFTGWSGGGCSGTNNCSVIMNSDESITATFVQETSGTPHISVSADELDFGTLKPGQQSSKTLTIVNDGQVTMDITFSGLEGTYFSISGSNTITLKPKRKYNLKITCKVPSEGSTNDTRKEDLLDQEDLNESELNDLPSVSETEITVPYSPILSVKPNLGVTLNIEYRTYTERREYLVWIKGLLEEENKTARLTIKGHFEVENNDFTLFCKEIGVIDFGFDSDAIEIDCGYKDGSYCSGWTSTKCKAYRGECLATAEVIAGYDLYGYYSKATKNLSLNIQGHDNSTGSIKVCCMGVCATKPFSFSFFPPMRFQLSYSNGAMITLDNGLSAYIFELILPQE
jgi:hypothetical protein